MKKTHQKKSDIRIAAANVNNATKLIEDELTVVVYLNGDVTSEQIENIKNKKGNKKL